MTVLRSQAGQNLQVLSDRVCIKLKSTASPNRIEMAETVRELPDDRPQMPAILEKYGIQMVEPSIAGGTD